MHRTGRDTCFPSNTVGSVPRTEGGARGEGSPSRMARRCRLSHAQPSHAGSVQVALLPRFESFDPSILALSSLAVTERPLRGWLGKSCALSTTHILSSVKNFAPKQIKNRRKEAFLDWDNGRTFLQAKVALMVMVPCGLSSLETTLSSSSNRAWKGVSKTPRRFVASSLTYGNKRSF